MITCLGRYLTEQDSGQLTDPQIDSIPPTNKVFMREEWGCRGEEEDKSSKSPITVSLSTRINEYWEHGRRAPKNNDSWLYSIRIGTMKIHLPISHVPFIPPVSPSTPIPYLIAKD